MLIKLPGLPGPDPGLLFPRGKSRQKHAQEGDTFDCVPLLRTTPRNDTKGARPLWNPPSIDETYPGFLWILPRVRFKNHVLPRSNRNIHLFNRPAGEVSSIDPL